MSQAYDNKGTTALWSNENYVAGGSHPRLKGKPEGSSLEG